MNKLWPAPMLATLTKNYFSDPDWIYERKLDGMRCILQKKGKVVTIWSRNKKNQNLVFPELVKALQKYSMDFILDAEIVTFSGTKTSFEKLQLRMHVQGPSDKLIKQVPITAFVFDIIYINGYDVTKFSLAVRKQILAENFKFIKPLKLISYKRGNGLKYFKYACAHGWEGIIAKDSNSTYVHKRSTAWLKFKCGQGQEFVIGGYTLPQGSRMNLGALLIGYYKNGKLKYAGKVGTGFNTNTLTLLGPKLQKLKVNNSPFTDYQKNIRGVTWVKPSLVVELQFTEWTSDGRLRHPSYIGLRSDKSAKQVTREA